MKKLYFNYFNFLCLYLVLLFKITNGELAKGLYGTIHETAHKNIYDDIHKFLYPKEDANKRGKATNKQGGNMKYEESENPVFTFAVSTTTGMPKVMPTGTPTKVKQILEKRPIMLVKSSTPGTINVQETNTKSNSNTGIDRRGNFAGIGLPERKRSEIKGMNHKVNNIKSEDTEDSVFTFAVSTTTRIPQVIPTVTPTEEEQISEKRPIVFGKSSTSGTNNAQKINKKVDLTTGIDGRGNYSGIGLTERKRSDKRRILEVDNIKYEATEDPLFTFAASTTARMPQVMPTDTPIKADQNNSEERPFVFVTSSTPGINTEQGTTAKSYSTIRIVDRANFVGGCLSGSMRTDDGRCEVPYFKELFSGGCLPGKIQTEDGRICTKPFRL